MSLRRSKVSRQSIELTPIIDMIFIILVFVMLGSAFLRDQVHVDLPSLTGQSHVEQPPLYIIRLHKNGDLFLNSKHITMTALMDRVSIDLAPSRAGQIVIRADKHTNIQHFLDLLLGLQKNGIDQIGIEHDDTID